MKHARIINTYNIKFVYAYKNYTHKTNSVNYIHACQVATNNITLYNLYVSNTIIMYTIMTDIGT
jgi:hypothetical protein